MLRRLRKFLFLITSVCIGALLLAVFLAYIFEDKIGNRLLSALNYNLEQPIVVSDLRLSLIAGFPDARVKMKRVTLDGSADSDLLSVEQIAFNLSIPALLKRRIDVKSVRIEDGDLFISRNKKGRYNYQITKKAKKVSNDGFEFNLSKARLKNVRLQYKDQKRSVQANALIKELELAGVISTEQGQTDIFGEIKVVRWTSQNEEKMRDQLIIVDAFTAYDIPNGEVRMMPLNIGMDGNVVQCKGSLKKEKNTWTHEANLAVDRIRLAEVVPVLKRLGLDLPVKGVRGFLSAQGNSFGDLNRPQVTANYELSDGQIAFEEGPGKLKDIQSQGRLSVTRAKEEVVIDELDARFLGNPFHLELGLEDFDDPTISASAEGHFPAEVLQMIDEDFKAMKLAGQLHVDNWEIEGKLNDLIGGQVNKANTHKGQIGIENLSFEANKDNVQIDQATILILDHSLGLDECTFAVPGMQGTLKGTVLNLWQYVLKEKDNSTEAVRINADLAADQLDLEQFLAWIKDESIDGSIDSLSRQSSDQKWSDFFAGSLNAQIKSFKYRNIQAKAFDGSCTFDNRQIVLSGDLETMNGSLNVEGDIKRGRETALQAILIGENIDIHQCFEQCENFGQDFIKDEHLYGALNANVLIEAKWDEDGRFLRDDLHVLSNTVISDGELIDFKLLYDFSEYIKIKDLQHIKFAAMQNWVEIKNNRIHLPVTFIQSNACNISINGVHTFDHQADYQLKVNAGQVFFNKFKKYNPEKKPLKARKKGFFNLYYHLYGPVDNLTYRANKARVKSAFEKSERQKEAFRRALAEAFGETDSLFEPEAWQDEIPDYFADDVEDDEYEYIEGF